MKVYIILIIAICLMLFGGLFIYFKTLIINYVIIYVLEKINKIK